MPDFFYRFLLFESMFNYDENYVYTNLLQTCIKSGIQKIEDIPYMYKRVTFNNNIVYTYWNENKYYAWLSIATIVHSDTTNQFKECRPSIKTMYQFKKLLENFYLGKHKPKIIKKKSKLKWIANEKI